MLQNKGSVFYGEYTYCNNNNYGGYRYDNSDTNFISCMEKSEEDLTISDTYFNFKEVRKMEDMNILVSAIGSAITAIYVLVKTIFNLIKKFKK